jgi:hypothetical protein
MGWTEWEIQNWIVAEQERDWLLSLESNASSPEASAPCSPEGTKPRQGASPKSSVSPKGSTDDS